MKKSIKISGLMSAMLLVAGGVHAAGLGKLSVQSALGQPLRAEIELLSVSKEELPGVTARLASQELFRQARLERSSALSGLEFEVTQRANGQPVLRISSANPIAEPFMDMLIELNWSTGRVIREYTLLLDPPASERSVAQAAPIRPAAPVSGTATGQDATGAADRGNGAAAKARPAPQAERYGPVKSGETLRAIANRVRTTDVTLEQMMAGLYLDNKAAFIDGNMNLLKKGAVLKVPSADAVQQKTTPADAVRMLRKHVDEWHAYRSRVAEMAGMEAEARADVPAATGKITPRVEDKVGAPSAPRDVLQLSKGEPGTDAKADRKLQERIQSMEEELAAKSRALQESQERVSQLEQTVKDMQKLLEMKAQEVPPAKAPEAELPPPETPDEEAPVVETAPPPPVVEAKPAPTPLVPPPPTESEDSWLSTFVRNPAYIGGLVAAGLLSGLLWMMMVGNRRRQGLNKFEDSIMTGGDFKSGAIFNTAGTAAATTGGAATTEGSMLLTDFSRLGLGAIDTHEVDPIAEAEVYMAYGRDAQAEEILKEALEKDSSRHEVALKLLEIYAARKDPLAFETTASELYAGLGGQDTPVWQRAAEMGRAIDPDNPLYRMAQGQSFASASDSMRMEAPAVEAPVMEAEPEAPASAEDLSLDFATTTEAEPAQDSAVASQDDYSQAQVSLGDDDNVLDFDSAFADVPTQETVDLDTAPTLEVPAEEVADLGLDFEPAVVDFTAVEAATDEASQVAQDVAEEVVEFSLDEALLEQPETGSAEITLTETLDLPEDVTEAMPQAVDELLDLDLPTEEAAAPAEESLPDLDFAGIDLDLDAAAAQEALISEVAEEAQAVPEMVVEETVEESVAEATAPFDAEFATQDTEAAASDTDSALLEEVNTKLDLARAYLEMGDREGAREILHEVLQEGNDAQKGEAEKLLSQAG